MRTEGPFGDFKLEHHKNDADLLHDVLCLANAGHSGRRYLVFGVENRTFEMVSIAESEGRRTSADIQSVFRDNARKFFQSRIPEIHLAELEHDGKSLDVLVIEDRPHKPYYLVEDYSDAKRRIRPHHIYTRVGDTNTPLPCSAAPHEIERMWRERFGLDMPPLERAKRYLADPDAWVPTSEDPLSNASYYHRDFPEFTLTAVDEDSPVIACNEEWTRGEIRTDDNSTGHFKLYYHQTLLVRSRFVIFDNRKKLMVAPCWEPRGAGRFYFYRANSVAYGFQRLMVMQGREDDSVRLRVGGTGPINDEARALWPNGMRIPVLQDGELEGFLAAKHDRTNTDPSRNEAEQYTIFLQNQLDFEHWRQERSEQ